MGETTADTAERVWLERYPAGVPAEIDPDAYGSLVEMFERSVARFAGCPAYTSFGATLDYRALDRKSRAFASFLQHELGLVKGDRIALMMPNLLQYPICLFGALRAGLTVVNTNPQYTPRELGHQLADSGAAAIVVFENFAHVLEQCLRETQIRHIVVTRIGDALPQPKALLMNVAVKYVRRMVPRYTLPGAVPFTRAVRGADRDFAPVAVGSEDLAFLQYTGGTTGLAKGAMLTHRNIVANLEQSAAWIASVLREGEEVVITALPLYHIFALTANCLVYMKIGGCNALITDPRDMPGFVKTLRGIPFTAITGVNTLYNGLLNTPGFAELDFSTLKVSLAGGMATQEDVARRWHRVTGRVLIEAYGLTETSPALCINPLDIERFNGTIGLPVPSTDVRILDDAGHRVATGEPGELCVKGPQVMRGYWQRPDETEKSFTEDGWLRTGDVAVMTPDGFFKLVDRKKDMILVSGFNVFPNEVEGVLASHPGVVEAGVIGVPDERSGEAVMALVVRQSESVTADELQAYSRERLTGYKRPRDIRFVDALPKSNVGKILRRELRERYARS